MSETKTAPKDVTTGVETLIGRLKDEGVAAGRAEAERVVAEAKAKADTIVASAREEAERRVDEARAAAARETSAAQDALRLAARDAVLAMKRTLTERFAGEIGRLVSDQMRNPDLLRQLILVVAGRTCEEVDWADVDRLEVILPRAVVGLDQLRRRPDELTGSDLTGLVLAVTGDVLREGVAFRLADGEQAGIQVRLVGTGVQLDLTDQGVAEVLMEHLQPRFRALLEGMVK